MILKKTKYFILIGLIFAYFFINSLIIYKFSFVYNENKSDVAIVLGAGTNNGKLSPIFKERLNHCILLYNNKIVDNIILTGGFGKGQKLSDSRIAMNYVIENGILEDNIIIEEKSKFTIENLKESKRIMDSIGLKNALLVSDPIHMKRAIKLAEYLGIDCNTILS